MERLTIPTGTPADFTPTREGGLTAQEAQERIAAGQGNASQEDNGKSIPQILAQNFFTPFNLLNFALAACLLAVGSYRNMLFLGVVFSNTIIGTVQELRARAMINRLRILSEAPVHPLRAGEELSLPREQLVRDDLLVLRAGDQIPVDGIIREGSCAADESLLTGESDAVQKQPGDWLMSGSHITEGRVILQTVHVGASCYAARLMTDAKKIRPPKSELMSNLNQLIRFVSAVLIPVGLLLFARQYFLQKTPITDSVSTAVAAMVGMIPEGLMLLTSVALLVGVIRLGQRQTLVQELYGIESLARVDTLCLDKTGTLTTGSMTLEHFLPADADEAELQAAAARFAAAFETAPGTLAALKTVLPAVENTAMAVLPFSSARKLSAASFPDGKTLILGAPTFVLRGAEYPASLREKIEAETEAGLRVLILAEAVGVLAGNKLPAITRVLGAVALHDELRASAAETLGYFREQGVDVRVISGDDPRTVSAVAHKVGLVDWERAIDLATVPDDQLAEIADQYTVFGRVTPERKRQLVEALKQHGHTVAMTGDGVNDIPALRASDCSIAMGNGADATRHAAQLVLLDSDFASLPVVVGEGRRVINNITRTASVFLVKTLYSMALAVLLLALPLAYPFQPIQLTLISSVTIGIPTFFLALEPQKERVQGHFLRTVMMRAIPAAVAVVVCTLICMAYPLETELQRTGATLIAGIMGLLMLVRTAWPLNRYRTAVCVAMPLCFAAAVLFAPSIFYLRIDLLTGEHLLWLAGLTVLGGCIMAAADWVTKFVQKTKQNA